MPNGPGAEKGNQANVDKLSAKEWVNELNRYRSCQDKGMEITESSLRRESRRAHAFLPPL
jgi:hypothetical protein